MVVERDLDIGSIHRRGLLTSSSARAHEHGNDAAPTGNAVTRTMRLAYKARRASHHLRQRINIISAGGSVRLPGLLPPLAMRRRRGIDETAKEEANRYYGCASSIRHRIADDCNLHDGSPRHIGKMFRCGPYALTTTSGHS